MFAFCVAVTAACRALSRAMTSRVRWIRLLTFRRTVTAISPCLLVKCCDLKQTLNVGKSSVLALARARIFKADDLFFSVGRSKIQFLPRVYRPLLGDSKRGSSSSSVPSTNLSNTGSGMTTLVPVGGNREQSTRILEVVCGRIRRSWRSRTAFHVQRVGADRRRSPRTESAETTRDDTR
jgi:hypothetical protein